MTDHEETARGLLQCYTPNVCGLLMEGVDYRCTNCTNRPAVAAALAQAEAKGVRMGLERAWMIVCAAGDVNGAMKAIRAEIAKAGKEK